MEQDPLKRFLEELGKFTNTVPKHQRVEEFILNLTETEIQDLAALRTKLISWVSFTVDLPWVTVYKFLAAVGASDAYDHLKSQHEYWETRVKYEFPANYQAAHVKGPHSNNMEWTLYLKIYEMYQPGISRLALIRDLRKPISSSISPWFLYYQHLQNQVSVVRAGKFSKQEKTTLSISLNVLVSNEPLSQVLWTAVNDLQNFAVLTNLRSLVKFQFTERPVQSIIWVGNLGMWTEDNTIRLTGNVFGVKDGNRADGAAERMEIIQTQFKVIGNVKGEMPRKQDRLVLMRNAVRFVAGLDPAPVYTTGYDSTISTGSYNPELKEFTFLDGTTTPLDLPEHLRLWAVLTPGAPFAPIFLVEEDVELEGKIYDLTNSQFTCGIQFSAVNGWLTYKKEDRWFAINIRRYAECKAIGNWKLHIPIELPPFNVRYNDDALALVQTEAGFSLIELLRTETKLHLYPKKTKKKLIACHVCQQNAALQCKFCSKPICSVECSALDPMRE